MLAKVVALAATLVTVPYGVCFGSSFSQIVAFGDSLTDAGNASIATFGAFPPGSNYATRNVPVFGSVKYYTDGPNTTPGTGSGPTGLWIDQLAGKLGVADPLPSLAGGTNYAVGGALTGSANLGDMGTQIAAYLALNGGNASGSALYTFWGGANDIFATPTSTTATQSADNIEAEISQIAKSGGKYFLWLNLPALGNTPGAFVQNLSTPGYVTAENAATAQFNAEYSTDLTALKAAGVDVIGVDISSLFSDILKNPGKYGFTDATDGCIFGPVPCTAGSNPNQYVFWDDAHPTTAGNADIAAVAYDALATPEPATYALLLLGGCGLFALRRVRRTSK
jgi:phospholipase/lecithinase/hemolysin